MDEEEEEEEEEENAFVIGEMIGSTPNTVITIRINRKRTCPPIMSTRSE